MRNLAPKSRGHDRDELRPRLVAEPKRSPRHLVELVEVLQLHSAVEVEYLVFDEQISVSTPRQEHHHVKDLLADKLIRALRLSWCDDPVSINDVRDDPRFGVSFVNFALDRIDGMKICLSFARCARSRIEVNLGSHPLSWN